MSDSITRYTELKLDGSTYKLCFDFKAVERVEDETGIRLLLGVNFRSLKVSQVRAMLWASALRAHPDLTLEQIDAHFRKPKNIAEAANVIVEAWATSNKDEEDENPPQPEPAAAENA